MECIETIGSPGGLAVEEATHDEEAVVPRLDLGTDFVPGDPRLDLLRGQLMPSVENATQNVCVANLPEPMRLWLVATRPAGVPAIESTDDRPRGVPTLCHCTPSELVQTVSVAEGSPATATRPAGQAATSTCGATIALTCVHVWPSAEVQTKALGGSFVVP